MCDWFASWVGGLATPIVLVLSCYWGNYLVEKAHVAAVGPNLTGIDTPPLTMAPLDDPNAEKWVAGQTHVVADVDVSGPDQFLTIITSKDREKGE